MSRQLYRDATAVGILTIAVYLEISSGADSKLAAVPEEGLVPSGARCSLIPSLPRLAV